MWPSTLTLTEERPWEWRAGFLGHQSGRHRSRSWSLTIMWPICGAYAISEYFDETVELDGSSRGASSCSRGTRFRASEVAPAGRLVPSEISRGGDGLSRRREGVSAASGPNGGSPNLDAIRAGHRESALSSRLYQPSGRDAALARGEALSFADLAAAAHLSALDYLGEVPWEDYEPAPRAGMRFSSRDPPSGPACRPGGAASSPPGPMPISISEPMPEMRHGASAEEPHQRRRRKPWAFDAVRFTDAERAGAAARARHLPRRMAAMATWRWLAANPERRKDAARPMARGKKHRHARHELRARARSARRARGARHAAPSPSMRKVATITTSSRAS